MIETEKALNQESEAEETKSEETETESPESLLYDEKPETENTETGAEEVSDQEQDETPISSLAEMIETQEWDPDWVNAWEVDVKVNGTPAKATLADLVKNYQIGEAAEHRLDEAKSKAKAITEAAAEQSKALEGQFATVAKLIEGAESLIDQDVKAIDWNKLREDDPAEYAAKKQEVAERREALNKLKSEAQSTWQQSAEKTAAEHQEKYQQYLQSEQSALLEKLPEWRDEAKAKTEKAELASFLLKQGFTQQDIVQASDHRLVLLARKAMLYDQGQAKVSTAKKKVVKAAKTLKPGASADQQHKPKDPATILYGSAA